MGNTQKIWAGQMDPKTFHSQAAALWTMSEECVKVYDGEDNKYNKEDLIQMYLCWQCLKQIQNDYFLSAFFFLPNEEDTNLYPRRLTATKSRKVGQILNSLEISVQVILQQAVIFMFLPILDWIFISVKSLENLESQFFLHHMNETVRSKPKQKSISSQVLFWNKLKFEHKL